MKWQRAGCIRNATNIDSDMKCDGAKRGIFRIILWKWYFAAFTYTCDRFVCRFLEHLFEAVQILLPPSLYFLVFENIIIELSFGFYNIIKFQISLNLRLVSVYSNSQNLFIKKKF